MIWISFWTSQRKVGWGFLLMELVEDGGSGEKGSGKDWRRLQFKYSILTSDDATTSKFGHFPNLDIGRRTSSLVFHLSRTPSCFHVADVSASALLSIQDNQSVNYCSSRMCYCATVSYLMFKSTISLCLILRHVISPMITFSSRKAEQLYAGLDAGREDEHRGEIWECLERAICPYDSSRTRAMPIHACRKRRPHANLVFKGSQLLITRRCQRVSRMEKRPVESYEQFQKLRNFQAEWQRSRR